MTDLAEQKIYAVKQSLTAGVAPTPETVRSFLLWFGGASRRSARLVNRIRSFLDGHGLRTEPDFESVWLDEEIKFVSAASGGQDLIDPVVRIGRIDAANHRPVSVSPNATLAEVVTIMLTNDFSQVPVMTGPRDVKGVVSWKTIGTRLSLKKECNEARDAMEEAVICSSEETLFEAMTKISREDYVLVSSKDKSISGIVTAADVNEQFKGLAEPFLLVGEIEIGLRRMLHQKFSKEDLTGAVRGDDERVVDSISDLTFGEYGRLLQSDDNWARVGGGIDKSVFISRLDKIREIRNEIMHFDPDGLDDEDLKDLREFARFMKRLREIGCA